MSAKAEPWYWRYVAMAAISTCSICSVAVAAFGFIFWDNIKAVRAAGVECFKPQTPSFDSIAAAAAVGRLDMLSLIFTCFALILAVSGLFGFWMFRREVLSEARDAAEIAVPDIVREVMQRTYPSPPDPGDRKSSLADVGYGKNDVPEGGSDEAAGSAGYYTPASDESPSAGGDNGQGPGNQGVGDA